MEEGATCCDVACLMALINILKLNLPSMAYRALLAVLSDYDPTGTENKERSVRYIKLLVEDKELAKCVLMSLPSGGPAECLEMPSKQTVMKNKRHKNRLGFRTLKGKRLVPQILHPRAMKSTASSMSSAANIGASSIMSSLPSPQHVKPTASNKSIRIILPGKDLSTSQEPRDNVKIDVEEDRGESNVGHTVVKDGSGYCKEHPVTEHNNTAPPAASVALPTTDFSTVHSQNQHYTGKTVFIRGQGHFPVKDTFGPLVIPRARNPAPVQYPQLPYPTQYPNIPGYHPSLTLSTLLPLQPFGRSISNSSRSESMTKDVNNGENSLDLSPSCRQSVGSSGGQENITRTIKPKRAVSEGTELLLESSTCAKRPKMIQLGVTSPPLNVAYPYGTWKYLSDHSVTSSCMEQTQPNVGNQSQENSIRSIKVGTEAIARHFSGKSSIEALQELTSGIGMKAKSGGKFAGERVKPVMTFGATTKANALSVSSADLYSGTKVNNISIPSARLTAKDTSLSMQASTESYSALPISITSNDTTRKLLASGPQRKLTSASSKEAATSSSAIRVSTSMEKLAALDSKDNPTCLSEASASKNVVTGQVGRGPDCSKTFEIRSFPHSQQMWLPDGQVVNFSRENASVVPTINTSKELPVSVIPAVPLYKELPSSVAVQNKAPRASSLVTDVPSPIESTYKAVSMSDLPTTVASTVGNTVVSRQVRIRFDKHMGNQLLGELLRLGTTQLQYPQSSLSASAGSRQALVQSSKSDGTVGKPLLRSYSDSSVGGYESDTCLGGIGRLAHVSNAVNVKPNDSIDSSKETKQTQKFMDNSSMVGQAFHFEAKPDKETNRISVTDRALLDTIKERLGSKKQIGAATKLRAYSDSVMLQSPDSSLPLVSMDSSEDCQSLSSIVSSHGDASSDQNMSVGSRRGTAYISPFVVGMPTKSYLNDSDDGDDDVFTDECISPKVTGTQFQVDAGNAPMAFEARARLGGPNMQRVRQYEGITEGVGRQHANEGMGAWFASRGVGGQHAGGGMDGQFASRGMNGQFTTGGMSGQFSTRGVGSQFSTGGVSGQFTTRGVGGQFVSGGNGGQFVGMSSITSRTDVEHVSQLTGIVVPSTPLDLSRHDLS